jgi:hypothetical protein
LSVKFRVLTAEGCSMSRRIHDTKGFQVVSGQTGMSYMTCSERLDNSGEYRA